MKTFDAVVIGAGPNGLSAAIVLARQRLSVQVREASGQVGGGARTAELTLPGFHHDVCSAVYPMAVGSSFFSTLPLDRYGLEWIYSDAPLAHPLDDEPACLLLRSIEGTAATIAPDGDRYASLLTPLSRNWDPLASDLLAPVHWPRHPAMLARFGVRAMASAWGLARRRFQGHRARALFAGLAAHAAVPLTGSGSAAIGLVLAALGHAAGWPIPRGGAQSISNALAAYLRSLGGEVILDAPVNSTEELPPSRAVLFDLTPHELLRVAGDRLPYMYRNRLGRFFYGPGAFKLDWALSGPIPWRAPECLGAGTVHLGGTLEEIKAAEAAPWKGQHVDRPFVLLAQPSVFDSSRAPAGRHTAWAYCHVPNGSNRDRTEVVESQVERFAPGFRDLILARSAMNTRDLELYNRNYVGGDISGGANTLSQLLVRPLFSFAPYRLPVPGWYLCSSSTPPGAGVHGLCGFHAARAVLQAVFSSSERHGAE